MQIQSSAVADTSSCLCLSHWVGHKGSVLQHDILYSKLFWTRRRAQIPLQRTASKGQCRSLFMRAQRSVQPQQYWAAHCSLHSTSISSSPARGARPSTELAAGNFMGLMGQILKDMSQTLPSGSSLSVSNLSYHPAGIHCARFLDRSCIVVVSLPARAGIKPMRNTEVLDCQSAAAQASTFSAMLPAVDKQVFTQVLLYHC